MDTILKRYEFILNFDNLTLEVKDQGQQDSYQHFMLLVSILDLHYWLVETIDTPFLSQDSDYIVILDGKKDCLTMKQWLDFGDMINSVMFG